MHLTAYYIFSDIWILEKIYEVKGVLFFLFPSLTMLLLWLNDNIEFHFKAIVEYNIPKQSQLPVLIHFKHILLN